MQSTQSRQGNKFQIWSGNFSNKLASYILRGSSRICLNLDLDIPNSLNFQILFCMRYCSLGACTFKLSKFYSFVSCVIIQTQSWGPFHGFACDQYSNYTYIIITRELVGRPFCNCDIQFLIRKSQLHVAYVHGSDRKFFNILTKILPYVIQIYKCYM